MHEPNSYSLCIIDDIFKSARFRWWMIAAVLTLIPVFFRFPRVLPSPIAAASYFLMASCPQPPPRTAHSFAIHSCHDHISRPIVNRSTAFSARGAYHLLCAAIPPKVIKSYLFFKYFFMNVIFKLIIYSLF